MIVACLVTLMLNNGTMEQRYATGTLLKETSTSYVVDFTSVSNELNDKIEFAAIVVRKQDCVVRKRIK